MGAQLREQSTWFPRSDRAAQRRKLEQLRSSFSRAQTVYDDYQARRPRVLSLVPEPSVPVVPPQTEPVRPIVQPDAKPVATTGYVSPIAEVVPTPSAAPDRAVLQRRRNWILVVAVILGTSLASLGVVRDKLRGRTSAAAVAALDDTAFEATIQPATTATIAAPASAI